MKNMLPFGPALLQVCTAVRVLTNAFSRESHSMAAQEARDRVLRLVDEAERVLRGDAS